MVSAWTLLALKLQVQMLWCLGLRYAGCDYATCNSTRDTAARLPYDQEAAAHGYTDAEPYCLHTHAAEPATEQPILMQATPSKHVPHLSCKRCCCFVVFKKAEMLASMR